MQWEIKENEIRFYFSEQYTYVPGLVCAWFSCQKSERQTAEASHTVNQCWRTFPASSSLERQLAVSQTYEAQARGVVAQYVRLTLGDVPEVLSKASLQGELGYGREEQSLATGKGPLPFLFWVLRN